ncbi:hypothetical protein [Litoreibacter halocynthiae]|uniref:hypothetical protein n=1 Tax=Litoreibacter halocynthiae TaxID=1242689 RepID=UPI0013C3674A|nr:hypothetical protein [Litoreibacter halocynthiae]
MSNLTYSQLGISQMPPPPKKQSKLQPDIYGTQAQALDLRRTLYYSPPNSQVGRL